MKGFLDNDLIMQELRKKQQRKANLLKNSFYEINRYVNQINEINSKIDDANSCLTLVKSIPENVSPITTMLGSVGEQAQLGIFIDGSPVGGNISSSSLTISGEIESTCSSMSTKIMTFAEEQKTKGDKIKIQAEEEQRNFNNILRQDPINLGDYGPAPTCPMIPKIKSIGN